MSILEILLLSLCLSTDAFAVSICIGSSVDSTHKQINAIKAALFFGFFQGIMPIAGWLGASMLNHFLASFNHWIAAGLLLIIGIKMLYEARCQDNKKTAYSLAAFLSLAFATSIDAFAAGVTFGFINVNILIAVIVITITTATLSFFGVLFGSEIGKRFGGKTEIAGGLILIFLSAKILYSALL